MICTLSCQRRLAVMGLCVKPVDWQQVCRCVIVELIVERGGGGGGGRCILAHRSPAY